MPYADTTKQRDYRRRWYNSRRDEWVAANGPCVQCGSNNGLQVDHIDRHAKVSHRIWSWSRERRDAELTKCQVLCRSCHHAKTAAENSRPMIHGQRSTYERGCRCDLCREAKNAYQNACRARSRQRRESSPTRRPGGACPKNAP